MQLPPGYPTPLHPDDPRVLAGRRQAINDLHDRCADLAATLGPRLPHADRERLRVGLAVGEWMPLLDDLCAALVQDRIPVTAAERDLLVEALDLLGAGDDTVPSLRDRDTTLAALVIDG